METSVAVAACRACIPRPSVGSPAPRAASGRCPSRRSTAGNGDALPVRSALPGAPSVDLRPDGPGFDVQDRADTLEGEEWLAIPALDPLLGLPAEQAGRVFPGILLTIEAANRILENRESQPHLACSLDLITELPEEIVWQRLVRMGSIQVPNLKRRSPLMVHEGVPPASTGFEPHYDRREGCSAIRRTL